MARGNLAGRSLLIRLTATQRDALEKRARRAGIRGVSTYARTLLVSRRPQVANLPARLFQTLTQMRALMERLGPERDDAQRIYDQLDAIYTDASGGGTDGGSTE
jgi:hypothetical protein